MIEIIREMLFDDSKELLFLKVLDKKGEELIEIVERKEILISKYLSGLDYIVG